LPTCFWQCQFPEFHPTVARVMSQRENGVCDDCCHAYFVAHGEEQPIQRLREVGRLMRCHREPPGRAG